MVRRHRLWLIPPLLASLALVGLTGTARATTPDAAAATSTITVPVDAAVTVLGNQVTVNATWGGTSASATVTIAPVQVSVGPVDTTLTDGTHVTLSQVTVTTSSATLTASAPTSTSIGSQLCQLANVIASGSLTTITSSATLMRLVNNLLDSGLKTL